MSNVYLEVITDGMPFVDHERAESYGDKAVSTTLRDAKPLKLYIVKDGEPQISIRIMPDGSIDILNHHGSFDVCLGKNITLQNDRPWREDAKAK